MREVVVEAAPEHCLARIEASVVSELGNDAEVSRPTPYTFKVLARRRTMLESIGGWLVAAVLTVVTFGLFAVFYLVYWIFVVGKTDEATVTATPEGERTRLMITSNNGRWERFLEDFARKEL